MKRAGTDALRMESSKSGAKVCSASEPAQHARMRSWICTIALQREKAVWRKATHTIATCPNALLLLPFCVPRDVVVDWFSVLELLGRDGSPRVIDRPGAGVGLGVGVGVGLGVGVGVGLGVGVQLRP